MSIDKKNCLKYFFIENCTKLCDAWIRNVLIRQGNSLTNTINVQSVNIGCYNKKRNISVNDIPGCPRKGSECSDQLWVHGGIDI